MTERAASIALLAFCVALCGCATTAENADAPDAPQGFAEFSRPEVAAPPSSPSLSPKERAARVERSRRLDESEVALSPQEALARLKQLSSRAEAQIYPAAEAPLAPAEAMRRLARLRGEYSVVARSSAAASPDLATQRFTPAHGGIGARMAMRRRALLLAGANP